MRLFVPLRPEPSALLARANPVAKLASAAVLLLVLFVSVDAVVPAVILVGIGTAVRFSGIGARDLIARTWPILIAALLVGISNAVLAEAQRGAILLELGPFTLGAENLAAGLALGMRLLAIALSGVLALVTTDPTDLADALQQQLRMPPRLAVGALAAVRLLPMMASEWQTLRLARRARGVDAGRSPIAALHIAGGQLLALLVGAVRRATRLATAMEARGFGSRPCRSIARPQPMRPGDWRLIAGTAALGVGAVWLSVALGSWRFLFG
jgi:energy-coupling factor transport system permease protein